MKGAPRASTIAVAHQGTFTPRLRQMHVNSTPSTIIKCMGLTEAQQQDKLPTVTCPSA